MGTFWSRAVFLSYFPCDIFRVEKGKKLNRFGTATVLPSESPLWVREVLCETTRSRAAVRTEVRRRFHDGTGNWSALGGGGAALPQCPVCSWFFIFREAAEKVAHGFTMVVEVVGRAWAHARGSTTALLPLHFGRLRSVTARRGALRTHTHCCQRRHIRTLATISLVDNHVTYRYVYVWYPLNKLIGYHYTILLVYFW